MALSWWVGVRSSAFGKGSGEPCRRGLSEGVWGGPSSRCGFGSLELVGRAFWAGSEGVVLGGDELR